jgi:hypothetical protein
VVVRRLRQQRRRRVAAAAGLLQHWPAGLPLLAMPLLACRCWPAAAGLPLLACRCCI